MSATNFLEDAILRATLTGNTYAGGTVYVALYSSGPTEASSATELSGSGYARSSVAFSVTSGTATNTANVTIGPATANWSTATGWGIVDASTGGNILYAGNFGVPQTVKDTRSLTFETGKISISIN